MELESVTRLLGQARAGDAAAFDRAFSLILDHLRRAAHRQLRGRRGDTFSTTALVNEAWIKLSRAEFEARDREHFLAIAARAMRMIVMDHVRRACAEKRGGQQVQVTLDSSLAEDRQGAEQLLALDVALRRLAEADARLAQVVEWRYFAGMTELEVAGLMGLTERTVRRDWRKARAFLGRELAREDA